MTEELLENEAIHPSIHRLLLCTSTTTRRRRRRSWRWWPGDVSGLPRIVTTISRREESNAEGRTRGGDSSLSRVKSRGCAETRPFSNLLE